MRLLLCTVLALTSVVGLHAADSTDWITSLGGKTQKDRAGNVVAVSLRGSWIYDAQMIDLARTRRLQKLDLSHTRISDEGMHYLKDAPGIVDLNLFYAEQVTDQGMSAVREWKNLTRLNVRGTRISDGTLEIVSHLTQLEALDIANTTITDNGLDYLITLIHLKELSRWGIRARATTRLSYLLCCPRSHIWTSGPGREYRPDDVANGHAPKVGGAMREDLVRTIAGLKELRILKLGHTNISADGLHTMSSLTQVEKLGLEGCARVDDRAAAELAAWKNLKYVDLQETAVTSAGLEAMRRAKPGLVILGPATLGASRDDHPATGSR